MRIAASTSAATAARIGWVALLNVLLTKSERTLGGLPTRLRLVVLDRWVTVASVSVSVSVSTVAAVSVTVATFADTSGTGVLVAVTSPAGRARVASASASASGVGSTPAIARPTATSLMLSDVNSATKRAPEKKKRGGGGGGERA